MSRYGVPLCLVVAVLAAAGCVAVGIPTVVGSGVTATEDREVAGFTKVSASTGVDVTVTLGAEDAVEVTADDNVLPLVATTVEADTLRVRLTNSVQSRTPIKVAVTAKRLTGVVASAGAAVTVDKLAADAWTVDVSSGGSVTARGTAGTLTASVSSGGDFKGGDLACKSVTADASSGGSATVNATDALKASASSGGSVRYRGSPKDVTPSVSSGGSVSKE